LTRLALLLFALIVLAGPAATRPAATRPAASVTDNANHLYTLDGWGGVHAAGSAPTLSISAYWSGWDIARGLAILPDGSGGYALDGWGGVHPVGSAPALAISGYWQGWDIARGIALFADGTGGYVVDGWGGLHQFGSAPAVGGSAYWPGFDIVRGLVLLPGSTASAPGGYVLDGFGQLHQFGSAPAVDSNTYFANWDIARGVTLLPDAGATAPAGYVLDGWGGLHAFGGAPAVSGSYWPGWDIARAVVAWTGAPHGSPGGWTLDGWGGLHAFGSAPAENATGYWQGWDIARGIGGPGGGSGARSDVIGGVIQGVAYYRQDYGLSCEAASLEMTLSHEGRFVSQSTLLGQMGIDRRAGYYDYNGSLHWGDPYTGFVGNPNGSENDLTGYGTYFSTVGRVAQADGATVLAAGIDFSPQRLYTAVLQGHPAVAWVSLDWRWHPTSYWYAWDGRRVPWAGPVEHTVAVIGVSGSSVHVYNPVRGPQWISRSAFEAGYSTYHDMAVVIS